jgi:sigma-B regulation protein RsbU (phosphoserine phosphatase)
MPLLVTPVALGPWPARYLAGALLSAPLLFLRRRHGLTATRVAAVLAFLLPTAALALRYPSWLPITAAVGLLGALAPLVAGFIGIARVDSVEHDPGAVPEFVRREERERRLTYEMDLLARMQLGLLPQGLPRLPGYEVTARSLLATEAGGDLYDFLRDERGRLWIAAGDVSGHGYSCAIGQASVKAALLSLVDSNATPAKILDRVDRVMRGSSVGGRQFATLCLLCLEEATGRIVLSNAGHPFPLLATPQQEPRELDVPGLPLGQGPPRRYRDLEVTIPRGGVLLLYSDGLYEATDPAGVPYGFDRPRRILADAAAWNAAEVLERLLFDWRRHLAGSGAADDTTLVVLKRV